MQIGLEELQETIGRWEEEHLNRMERFNERVADYRDNLHEAIWGPEDEED